MANVFTRRDVRGRRLVVWLVGCALGSGSVACSDDTSPNGEVPQDSTTSEDGDASADWSAVTSSQMPSGSSATRTDLTSEGSNVSAASSTDDAADASTSLTGGEQVDAGGETTFTGETPDAATPVVGLSLEELRGVYLTWETHTAEPQNISAEIFGLCRAPSAAEEAFVESVHGDELYLFDWLNPAAQRGAAQFGEANAPLVPPERPFEPLVDGGVVFEVGAAIVKEKLVRTGQGYELAALGLMVKREPGFDPASGDWEFGYWTPSEGMLSGPAETAACGACHASSPTDFVFLDESWRLPSP